MSEWDALHWDERVVYLAGLAEVWQTRTGGGVTAAASSPTDTVESADKGIAGLSEFGIGVSQEGVPQ